MNLYVQNRMEKPEIQRCRDERESIRVLFKSLFPIV